ncbi:hypothetical protein EP7_000149 [Isosphaeraceae bacterium EP7]
MMSRLALLTAALFAVSGFVAADRAQGSSLPAGASASYRLTNTSTTSVSQVIFNVLPPGSVVPVSEAISPLTILPSSKGFDQGALQVALGTGKSPDGETLQGLALDFGAAGLGAGGQLDFNLSLDKAFQGVPQLVLPTTTTGLSIVPMSFTDPVTTPGTGTGTPPTTQVPEPAAWLLWATLAGLGWLRASTYRRRRLALA